MPASARSAPGTGFDQASGDFPSVHVDAAAHAAWLAIDQGASGIYNVAEDDGKVDSRKAVERLGWTADFRLE